MHRFLLLGLLAAFVNAEADDGAREAAETLTSALRGEEMVTFYFVARTGSYVLRGASFKAAATTIVHRRCGANCHNFMSDVIDHLRNSTQAVCQYGQENVLIETGSGLVITYSHSGRSIEWGEKCYFNESGIDRTIKTSAFLFN